MRLVRLGVIYDLGHVYEAGMPVAMERPYELKLIGPLGPFGKNAIVVHSESLCTQIGQVGTASVQLAFFGNWTSPIDFSNFGIRYADLFSSQLGVNGFAGIGVPVTPPIPEPASAAVFGLGSLLVVAAIRRRRAN